MISFDNVLSRRCRVLFHVLSAVVLSCAARLSAVPAFPGAEGFGANASGGRGGTVYHVTNLNDSGAGSFRDAVGTSGRTVVFDVGGIITLTSPVVVKSNITIAGQTAPGEGVTLYGDRLSFSGANNTIMRYVRVREGINGDSGTDALSAASGNTMMFDHVSVSWGRDETFSLSGTPANITLQDCIIGQGLLIHSAGGLIQTDGGVSILRTLYIDNHMRNPKVKGVNDYQNNVVYNWGSGGGYIPAGDSAGMSYVNVIGCYFIAGPSTPAGSPFKSGNQNFQIFHAGNFQDLDRNGALDGSAVTDASFPTLRIMPTQFDYPKPATLLTAQQSYAHVLANAGASLHRDHADTYMLAELASNGASGAQIYNESEIGGVGTVAGGIAPADTDGDGMPDWWEEAAGTNPSVADNNGDLNGDGYTNLENYINALAPAGVPAATIDGITPDTGLSTADGVTSANQLTLRGTAGVGSAVTVYRVDLGAIGSVIADATGHWQLDYTGTVLADRTYAFQATADLGEGKVSPPTRAFVVKVDRTAALAPAITSLVVSPALALSGTSEPGSAVTVTLSGGGVVATAVTDGLGNWSAPYSGPALPPGVHTLSATAVDVAGNGGPVSADYTVDTSLAAPVFTSVVTDSGGSTTDRITNDRTFVFNGTTFPNAVVTVSRAGVGIIGTATASAAGAWSFDYTGTTLPAGTHTFTATASNGGVASPASGAFVVTIDLVRPTISSIRRLDPTTAATTASTVVFRVTFAEPVSGVDLADFAATLSGATASLSSITPVSSTTYDVSVSSVGGDGTVRLDLKSSGTGIADAAGNTVSGGYSSGQTYTIRLPGSGVWISPESDDAWSPTGNWELGVVANGAGATADFSQQNIDAPVIVRLDSSRTVGRIVFGDTDWATAAEWTLTDAGSPGTVLTLQGSKPTLQVDGATSPSGDTADVPAAAATPSNLDVVLAGANGFTKTGVGTLQILRPATISGPLTITKGIVQVGPGGALSPSAVTISTSQQLRVAGGTFSTTGDVTWNSGTGTGIIVSSGTANFQRILPSNTRNSFVKVTGGVLTATEINFPRSGDSESQAVAAGIQISGGEAVVGTVSLGTADSWGALTVFDGRMTVSGQITLGWQSSSARGGVVRVFDGEFNAAEMIMSRNPGGTKPNANNVAKFTINGGVSNLGKLTLGYDPTSAGSATVSVADGELNLGSGGIVKNGASTMVTSITLNSGVLGATANWGTAVPITVSGTPATLAIRAGDRIGNARDIVLDGVVGEGGFAKTGAGVLTLGSSTTYTGATEVNAGTLRIDFGLPASLEPVTVNAGGQLAASGALSRPLVLNGGLVSPGGTGAFGTLAMAAFEWGAGGVLAIDLGATGESDQIAVGAAVAKGAVLALRVALTPRAGFAAGNTYTIATFASTDLTANDLVATGLPAGTGALFIVTPTALQVRIQATPEIMVPSVVSGMFGLPLACTATSTELPVTFAATGLPPGLAINAATGLISGVPSAAGQYSARITATNTAGVATKEVRFEIAKAPATISVGAQGNSTMRRSYDGTPKSASITSEPAGLAATYTYNGSPVVPTLPGTYDVVATVDDPNFTGTAAGKLVITITALVRHAPDINGELDGSFQMLSGENVVLNGSSLMSGDLLVPGTPQLRLNGSPTLVGMRDQAGDVAPANYGVTLSGGAMARYLMRRVNPIAMPVVSALRAPSGTRTVVLNRASDPVGDISTVRNLTLNGGFGVIGLPAGAYGTITVNGGGGLVLGVAGATEPAVYDMQQLRLNGGASVEIAGPVVLRLADDLVLNATLAGTADTPLIIELYRGGLTLNGSAVLRAEVIAPSGGVIINGSSELHGRVTADRLTVHGLLTEAP